MLSSEFVRAQSAKLIALSYTVTDAKSKAALLEMATDLTGWAGERDGEEAQTELNGHYRAANA